MWPNDVAFKVTDNLNGTVKPYDEKTSPSDLAFLQYTSGSTGNPKGVMVTFAALAANIDLVHFGYYQCYGEDGGIPDEIVGFSWLPQYHDLGLIYAAIAPFCAGWRMHLMSPVTFIQKPLLWLQLMSLHKVQWSVAPDFAFRLVARKFKEAQSRANGSNPLPGLDLSYLRYLTQAAEPARPETHEEFTEVFAPYGLRDKWYSSGYGLAENVVGLSYVHGFVLSKPREEDRSKQYVACGKIFMLYPSVTVKIVDPETCTEAPDGKTGELWIAGPTVAIGYYGKPALSNETFRAKLKDEPSVDFLRTGDLAFIQNDFLYICGRIKDLIIYNGVNYYPQDIEFVVQEASDAVRPGCVAAFSMKEVDSEDSIAIVFEIRRRSMSDAKAVCAVVREEVIQKIGLPVDRVVAIPEKTIPKTTSGKIQRRASRAALHQGELKIVHCSVRSSTGSLRIGSTPAVSERSMEFGNEPKFARSSFNEVLGQILGESFDPELTWEELGLSSMASVQLQNSISDTFRVSLPPDCFGLFPTPRSLETLLSKPQGNPFPVKERKLRYLKTVKLSWQVLGTVQALGIAAILLLVSVSIVPAWYVARPVVTNESLVEPVLVGDYWHIWAWMPLAIPTFMASFTVSVIAAKWLVIGQYYQEIELYTPSVYYLRWWFMDRVFDVWEFWVGIFIKDTPLLPVFYYLLGAQIHPSAKLKAFVREQDLVQIGKGTTLKHPLCCRRFTQWDSYQEGPTMVFSRINIGQNVTIEGMLCPGATIGDNALIEKLSVVEKGTQVRAGALASGNPALDAGESPAPSSCPCWWKLCVLKVIWLFIEYYFFVAIMFAGRIMATDFVPEKWRYYQLFIWIFPVFFFAVTAPITSVAVKWLLIGKRQPGPCKESLWREAADWAADFHFFAATRLLNSVSRYSRFWNIILWLHGMDIDEQSSILIGSFPPSQLDLISLRNSFCPVGSFETRKDGQCYRTDIIESSLGRNYCIGPGKKIVRATIQPMSFVQHDVIRDDLDKRCTTTSLPDMFLLEAEYWFYGILLIILVGYLSLIPSFEVWMLVSPPSVFWAVPTLAVVFFLQTVSWSVIYFLFELARHRGSAARTKPWSTAVFLHPALFFHEWSLVSVLKGTPLFWPVACLLGVKVDGRFLYFGDFIWDGPFLTIKDRTVCDKIVMNGHYVVHKEITLGPTVVSGILHEGTYVMANGVALNKTSGPWRAITGTSELFTKRGLTAVECESGSDDEG
jgi:acyl-CoA synthetase (AMP-forming)/AMP-acid ligase II